MHCTCTDSVLRVVLYYVYIHVHPGSILQCMALNSYSLSIHMSLVLHTVQMIQATWRGGGGGGGGEGGKERVRGRGDVVRTISMKSTKVQTLGNPCVCMTLPMITY